MTSITSAFRLAFQWRAVLRLALACTLLITVAGPIPAGKAAPASNTWYVTTGGNDNNTCLSLANACRSIGRAIDKATSGDTISIGAGTFFENLDIFENLTLQGAGVGSTVVDGMALGPALSVSSGGLTLSQLTLKNGANDYGGGLYVGTGVVTVSNVEVINNSATQGGAGIFNQGKLTLTSVAIKNNTNSGQDRGGGLLNLGEAGLTNVTVSDNSTTSGGGGIGNRGLMTITTSLIDHNLNASLGGGIANSLNGRLTIINSTISNHLTGGGLHNTNNGVVVISGGIITHNESSSGGGGIYNLGLLTVNSTGLYNNQTTAAFGGGLFNEGSATLNAVTIQGNSTSSGNGGGLYTGGISGSLTLNSSIIRQNQTTAGNGGGLYASAGSLSIIGGRLISNTSDSLGGGLYNAAVATITDLEITGNTATTGGGGLYNTGVNGKLTYTGGTLRLNNSTTGNGGGLNNTARADLRSLSISDNQASTGGGGLYNGTTGQLIVTGSTLHDNLVQQSSGGGIDNRGQLWLTTSSIYSNTSITQGGSGLYNAATAQLLNSTFTYNRVVNFTNGGALLNNGGGLLITNTTLSGNYGPNIVRTSGVVSLTNSLIGTPLDSGDNCVGALVSLGNNLDSGVSCGLTATGDISNTNPLLGTLQNNGGTTLTRSVQNSSPAVDAGNNGTCPSTDQRGVARPQGTACDIGAYEVLGFSNNISQTIGGQVCITSTTSISSNYTIGALHVGVNLSFEPRGDLRVTLYAPGNRQVHLLGNTGGTGKNLDVFWDDHSTFGPVGSEDHIIDSLLYKYVRVPDESLTVMEGRRLGGDWRLEVCNVGTSNGTLNRWTLVVPEFRNPKVFLPVTRR